MSKIMDRVLARVLRADVAGACTPDHGQSCGATTFTCHLGRLHKTTYGVVACNGTCPSPVTTNDGTC
jgi:hypothetical protein